MPDQPLEISQAELSHPLKSEIRLLKDIILSVHPAIREQVKWNTPAFFFDGEMIDHDPKSYLRDIVVFHLRKPTEIMLILPNGDKLKDERGLFTGRYADGRRMLIFKSAAEIEQSRTALVAIIESWRDAFAHK